MTSELTDFTEEHRCRTITTDHWMVERCDAVFGAAVCPHNGCQTPLHGHPSDFADSTFRCLGCNWIIVIDQEAIDAL